MQYVLKEVQHKKKWLIVQFLSSHSSLGFKRNIYTSLVQIFPFQAFLSVFYYCFMLDNNLEHPQANTCQTPNYEMYGRQGACSSLKEYLGVVHVCTKSIKKKCNRISQNSSEILNLLPPVCCTITLKVVQCTTHNAMKLSTWFDLCSIQQSSHSTHGSL